MKHLFLLSVFFIFYAHDAEAGYDRTCKYQIQMNASGIQTANLYNGEIHGRGYHKNSKGKAKSRAKHAVTECFKFGLNATNPAKCRDVGGKKTKHRLTEYQLQNTTIKKAAFSKACSIAASSGTPNKTISGIRIFLKNLSKNKKCRGISYDAKNLSTHCKDGQPSGERTPWRKAKTGWHDKGATQLKNHIKSHCKKTYNKGRSPRIHAWYLNNKNGKLKAKYTCLD